MSENKHDFENLKIYQRALEYVGFIYKITKKFPKEEVFFLTDQFSKSGNIDMLEYSGRPRWKQARVQSISKNSEKIYESVHCD